jgi:prepilin-type N-terminal cleavage/methylation domain-containing protein
MHRRHAFSLVELSIVLVILGLLAGGVISGQSLIRAAELQSISTDYARYMTAALTFQDKYFTIPGDMPNATKFWSERVAGHAGDLTYHQTINTTNGTCDGDGNRKFCSFQVMPPL